MRFVLYTDKTVSQCLKDLNERMQAKPTKTRPELKGWIEKEGAFSISLTGPVLGKINRTTRLRAHLEREKGTTIIRGAVSDGVGPFWTFVLFIVMVLVAGGFVLAGKPFYGVLTVLFGLVAFIPMRGDYVNSDRLLIEIERLFKASPRPPKK